MSQRMLKSKKKSAIIVTSSVMGAYPYPGLTTYSAAKSFSSFVAEALNFELKDKIDVISY